MYKFFKQSKEKENQAPKPENEKVLVPELPITEEKEKLILGKEELS